MFIDIEKWREIFNTLSRHKLRTSLTAFGVFWGIFMLTVLLGAGKGLENGVNDGFPRVTNTVYLWSQGPTQIPWQDETLSVTVSVGIAGLARLDDAESITKRADEALYISKHAGRNRVMTRD